MFQPTKSYAAGARQLSDIRRVDEDRLTNLAKIPAPERRLEAFAEHVQRTIERPLQALEQGLLLHKLEPARALLLAGFATPTVIDALSLDSQIARTTAVVVGVGGAWWKVRDVRTQVKIESPVGYLLDVRDRLTPKTLANRALLNEAW